MLCYAELNGDLFTWCMWASQPTADMRQIEKERKPIERVTLKPGVTITHAILIKGIKPLQAN